ncbi:transcription factor grauzone [Aedes albopictus]|uniref:C2H2-type domain-containing protein n=1 Tax=Aedes albopictus TaxID=7160 RepID=A0ABM1Z7V0_AEDAL|nr:transcription factor grauzone-like [Aedes albopictus]
MESDCFTCGQKAEKFFPIADPGGEESKRNIRLVMCQHFWFKADDLKSAIICELCWDKVDEFHRFYQEVKTLHEDREDSKPLSDFIKQEEIEIEACVIPGIYPVVALNVEETAKEEETEECKSEASDRCSDVPSAVSGDSCSPVRKRRRTGKREQKKKSSGPRIVRKRKKVSPEQQKAEDDVIKKHRPYLCEDCVVEEFEDFDSIRRHTVQNHDKPYIICCDNQYRTRAILYQHVQSVLNPQSIQCELCYRTFKFQSGYDRHKEEVHADEHLLIFKCDRCPKSFPKQKLLKRHLNEHETLEKEKAKCEVCGKCFRTQLHMKRHVTQVHEKIFEFMCEICSKGFMKRSELKDHRQYHELTADEMKKQCPICNKWLKNLRYWKRHVGRHQNEGEHKCEQCNHVSVNLVSLKLHIERKHGPNIKKYVCDLCGKEYSRPVTLKEHIANAHTGKPLYQCQFCDKSFFSNATMYAHRKKDHPQEWLQDHKAKYANSAEQGEAGNGSGN